MFLQYIDNNGALTKSGCCQIKQKECEQGNIEKKWSIITREVYNNYIESLCGMNFRKSCVAKECSNGSNVDVGPTFKELLFIICSAIWPIQHIKIDRKPEDTYIDVSL